MAPVRSGNEVTGNRTNGVRKVLIVQLSGSVDERFRRLVVALAGGSVLALSGCGVAGNATPEDESSARDDPPVPVAPVDTANPAMKPSELRRRLGIGDEQGQIITQRGQITGVSLPKAPVEDLTPLKGLPIEQLLLEQTSVQDLRPLQGLPLRRLWLNHTPVEDISPLSGMQLEELNLFGTRVEDLSPVRSMEIGTLWLRGTDVNDLSPLEGQSLVSLDIKDTPVADLSPLAGMASLRRLNIAGSRVTDLGPLKGLRLQRLIFTPPRIESGMEVIRNMDSLRELDVTLRQPQRWSPAEFWRRYEAGHLDGG